MSYDIVFDQPVEDVEGLIALAGNYVQVSDDLRPRVLEAARAVRLERRARWRIGQWAASIALAAVVLTTLYDGWPSSQAASQLAAWAARIGEPSQVSQSSSDSNWEMVESFTELRRHQARVLRLAL